MPSYDEDKSSKSKHTRFNIILYLILAAFLVTLQLLLLYGVYEFSKHALRVQNSSSRAVLSEEDVWKIVGQSKFLDELIQRIDQRFADKNPTFSVASKLSSRVKRSRFGSLNNIHFGDIEVKSKSEQESLSNKFSNLGSPESRCPPVPSCISGPPGPPGPAGRDGLRGLKGAKGTSGCPGYPGEDGAMGPIGPPGSRGLDGLPGPKGNKGDRGSDGAPGLDGVRGFTGYNGEKGILGEKGNKGDLGFLETFLTREKGSVEVPGTKVEHRAEGSDGISRRKGDNGDIGREGATDLGDVREPLVEEDQRGPSDEKGDKGNRGVTEVIDNSTLPEVSAIGKKGFSESVEAPDSKGERDQASLVGQPKIEGLPETKGKRRVLGFQEPKGYDISNSDSDTTVKFFLNMAQISSYTETTYPNFWLRLTDCVIIKIGPPTPFSSTSAVKGSWMIDSLPISEKDSYKFWSTSLNNPYKLIEYESKESFLANKTTKVYDLHKKIDGDKYLVYNGSFYYTSADFMKPNIIKYSLDTETSYVLSIPGLTKENFRLLYNTNVAAFDFNADENGLWVVFAVPGANNTGVVKINTNSVSIEKAWNITVDHTKFNEMFIANGVLYAIDGSKDGGPMEISVAVDLYLNAIYKVNLSSSAEMGKIISATYDFKRKQLLIVNNGVQSVYPVFCVDSESNITVIPQK